nr:MAG TPA: hypothetical protein [Caudoviricetes sp.]
MASNIDREIEYMILAILLCVLLLNHLVTQVDIVIYMLNVKNNYM